MAPMPDKPVTQDEIARAQVALRHVPAWLRYRELTQAALAERMDVSEPTVSKWLQGKQRMAIAQLVLIAQILETPWETLFEPPPGDGTGSRYKALAEAAQGLTNEQLDNLVNTARLMVRPGPGASD